MMMCIKKDGTRVLTVLRIHGTEYCSMNTTRVWRPAGRVGSETAMASKNFAARCFFLEDVPNFGLK